MFQTLYLGNLQGARIYIHWSFWILAVFIFLSGLSQGFGHAFALLGFVFAVFGCVFLHELGHAVAAKAFGRRTLEITLLPIGGVARIEGGEMGAVAEGWVAIAGPAVNFVIAFTLLIGSSLSGAALDVSPEKVVKLTAVQQLIVANLALAIFNLLPAFPLDGGRVLRSVLCYWLSRSQSLVVASRVGQWASALLILTSIVWWNFMGIIFGIVLFLINSAQRFQGQILGQRNGDPFQRPFPFDPTGNSPWDNRPGNGPPNDNRTIDALDVREVRR
jgi:Zn-dependent protease